MMTAAGAGLSIVVTHTSRLDPVRKSELCNKAGAQMYARGAKEWTIMLLSFTDDGRLAFSWQRQIDQSSFSAVDWKIVRIMGEDIKRRT